VCTASEIQIGAQSVFHPSHSRPCDPGRGAERGRRTRRDRERERESEREKERGRGRENFPRVIESGPLSGRRPWLSPGSEARSSPLFLVRGSRPLIYLRILVYLVIYDSGEVSLEHLLLSWYPSSPSPFQCVPLTSPAPHAPCPRRRVTEQRQRQRQKHRAKRGQLKTL